MQLTGEALLRNERCTRIVNNLDLKRGGRPLLSAGPGRLPGCIIGLPAELRDPKPWETISQERDATQFSASMDPQSSMIAGGEGPVGG